MIMETQINRGSGFGISIVGAYIAMEELKNLVSLEEVEARIF